MCTSATTQRREEEEQEAGGGREYRYTTPQATAANTRGAARHACSLEASFSRRGRSPLFSLIDHVRGPAARLGEDLRGLRGKCPAFSGPVIRRRGRQSPPFTVHLPRSPCDPPAFLLSLLPLSPSSHFPFSRDGTQEAISLENAPSKKAAFYISHLAAGLPICAFRFHTACACDALRIFDLAYCGRLNNGDSTTPENQ